MKNITFTLLVIGLLLGIGAKAQLPNVPHVDYSKKTGTITDTRDGKTYAYKKYGENEWFMQNLNWDGYDGKTESTRGTVGVWGSADPDGSKFGRFYSTISGVICPEGWRTPANGDWANLVQSVATEYNVSDLKDLTGKMYTFKEFFKYLRGGGIKPALADGLWEDGTGTVDDAIANETQFNALPMGEIADATGATYVAGSEVGKRLWFLGSTKDRYRNNPTNNTDGLNALRHEGKSGAFGGVRCVRMVPPDVEITTPYPVELTIKQIASTEREVKRHKGRMKRFDHVFTGFYAESGKVLKIKLETLTAAADGEKPQLVIGTRGQMSSTTAADKSQSISEITLVEGVNTITVPSLGDASGAGLLYFRYVTQVAGQPVGNVKITFMDDSQHRRAPHYKHGVTSDDEFLKMLSEYTTPEVMFTSDDVVVVTSRNAAHDYSVATDKTLWMEHLTKLLEIEDDISGMDNSDPNPLHHRMKKGEIRHLFVQTRNPNPNASDWRVAYPTTNRYLTPFKTPTNGYTNVSWQVAHEIGHQHQQLAYLIPQSGESTVNFYSFKVASYFDDGGTAFHVRTPDSKLEVFHRTYLKLSDEERIYEMDGTKLQEIIEGINRDELRMVPWEILFYVFGDDFYRMLHRITREENVENEGVSEQGDRRKVYLITRASLISGYDLRKYYDAWGIKVTKAANQQRIDKVIEDAGLQEPPRIDELALVSGTKFKAEEYTGWLPLPIKGIKTSVPANWTWETIPGEVLPEDKPDFSYPSTVLADTYVTDIKGSEDKNFGTAEILDIKLNNVAEFHRQSYVKFSLDELDKYTDKENYDVKVFAEFFLTSSNMDVLSTNWVLAPVADLTWEENTMTWNNKTAVGTPIIAKLPTFEFNAELPLFDAENKANFDITAYALSEYEKGNRIISLNINNDIAGAKVNSTFASREHEEVKIHPVISVRLYKKEPIVQIDQTITFPAIADITLGTGTVNAAATASSGLDVTYTSSNTAVATITPAGVITAVSVGTTTITASQAGNAQFLPAIDVAVDVVVKAAPIVLQEQTITFPAIADVTLGTGTVTAVATASSGLKVTYVSSNPAVATIDENGVITTLAVGTTTITASQAGNAQFLPAIDVAVDVVVKAAPIVLQEQTITFPAIADVTLGTGTVTAVATASSGLKVTYTSSNTAVATIDADGVITTLAVGTTTITASQAGNAVYLPATDVSVTVTVKSTPVTLKDQTITFPAIADVTLGTGTVTAGATASSGLKVTYTSSNLAVATIDENGVITTLAVGTTTITASQAGNAEYKAAVDVTADLTVKSTPVVLKDQTITFPAIADITLGTGTVTAGATTNSGLKVTYVSSNTAVATIDADGVITTLAVGTTTITASQAGNAEYKPATNVAVTVTVKAAPIVLKDQTITFPTIADITLGTGNVTAGATADSGLKVTYVSSNTSVATIDADGVITAKAVGTTTITASQAGNAEYKPATNVAVTVTVKAAPIVQKDQTITFPAIGDITLGTGTVTAKATADSGLKVTYTSSNTSVATIDADGVITAKAVGTTTITASQAGNAEYKPATNVAVTVTVKAAPIVQKDQTITFPAIADITLGTGTVTAKATADSGLKVTYTSSNTSVATIDADGVITAKAVGTTTITASQAGNAEYKAATNVAVTVTVKAAPVTDEIVLTINGEEWNKTSEYVIPCSSDISQLNLAVNENSGAKIKVGDKEATSYVVNLGIAPIQTINFSVIPQSGATTNHTLVVNKGVQFEDITVTKWGNTFIVNKDPKTNGGLTISGYKWFENGVEVSTKQYYEATKGGTAAEYLVELTTPNGVVRTCPTMITPRIVLLNIYPNPVKVGEPIYIDASQMSEEFFVDAKAYLYSLAGYTVMEKAVREKVSTVETPMTPGTYVLKVVSKTYSKEFKVIIK